MVEIYHVLPTDDLKPHIHSESCKCKPRIEVQPNRNILIVHNSYDAREFFEQEIGITGH